MGKIIAEIIMALFKKENRRTLWESVTKIPPALKYCLIFAIIVGFGYFGYRKVETMMDMTRLQAELAVL